MSSPNTEPTYAAHRHACPACAQAVELGDEIIKAPGGGGYRHAECEGRPVQVITRRYSTARVPGTCPACSSPIGLADPITSDDQDGKGWRHDACVPRPVPPPPPYPEELARLWRREDPS